LLNAYRSGRIPHAWLIGGPQGIGKATLAYRMARFVLANSNPTSPSVQRAETLALDPGDPVARQVTAGAHGGLLVLERGLNDRGVMRTVITVDETRETISFFGSTGGGGRLARLHRRYRRQAQSERRQRTAQDPRRAAATIAVPARQPFAGARVADDPVPLSQAAAAAARDRRRHSRGVAGC
jgi:hypothetical protein